MNNLDAYGTVVYDGTTTVDIFHNARTAFEAIESEFTLKEYNIKDSPRPEMLSYALYGTPHYYWVFFIINDIYDPFYDWVMSDNMVHEYTEQKYQYVGGANKVAYHENDQGERFYNVEEFPKGSNIWYDWLDDTHTYPQYTGTMIPYTNIEYEMDRNEGRRTINIVQPQEIESFVSSLFSYMGVS